MLHVRELQKARTMRVRSAESAAQRRKFLCTVNYEEIVNYGELYLLALARNRELPYSNFRRKETGSNEAEGKSPSPNCNYRERCKTLSRRQLLLSLLYGEAIALLVWLSPREKGPRDPPPSGPFSFASGQGDTQRAL